MAECTALLQIAKNYISVLIINIAAITIASDISVCNTYSRGWPPLRCMYR